MFKSLILTGLLSSGIGAFAITPLDNQPLYTPQEQAVIYDDIHFNITFNSNELNNYSFNNMVNYLLNIVDDENFFIDDVFQKVEYDEDQTTVIDTQTNFYYFEFLNNTYNVILVKNDSVDLNDQTILKGHFYYCSDDYTLNGEFNSDLTFTVSENFYQNLKSAIELDIQANTHSNSHSGLIASLISFVTLLTSGIVQLSTGIAGGIAHMAKALFLNAAGTHLSIFGGIIAIFAGLALAIALTTKVYTWITSLGN